MAEPSNIIAGKQSVSAKGNNTKRVISNSFTLFLRMLFVTVLNLYSVRFVLSGLGEVDYGIFYAVSGIVLMGVFLIPVVSSSLQRFYSYSLGKQDFDTLQSLYTVSINIVAIISILFFVIMEMVGMWYIQNYLNVPVDRMSSVIWVFHAATFSFIISLWLVPFTALIFSHEDMNIFAVLSCLDCFLKFVLALLLGYIGIDPLLIYSYGLSCIALFMFAMYFIVAKRKYSECKYQKVSNKAIYKSVLSFSGWTLYGALSGTALIQGSMVILNFFFGPLANAAFAIANNVFNAFNALSNSVVFAFKPAMVKVYAEDNEKELNKLFTLNNKLILYLLSCVCIPMVIEMKTILTLWLGECTAEMIIFCRLFIIYAVCLIMNAPITTLIQSTGDIKKYFLVVETLMLLSLPGSILLFHYGFPSHYLFFSLLCACLVSHLVRMLCLKEKMSFFSIKRYIYDIIAPGLFIVAIAFTIAYFLKLGISNEYISFVAEFMIVPTLLLGMVYLFGLSKVERRGLLEFVMIKIRRRD